MSGDGGALAQSPQLGSLQAADFETTARSALSFLHSRLGFGLWMVTRVEGDDWIVLQSEDHGYGVQPGSVFRWADSFCSEMVKGNGPRIAPRANDVPAYAAAPIGRQVPINAYVGVPLVRADGSLFGTLCAIDPDAQPDTIVSEQDLVELVGGMLSTILEAETKAVEAARRTERLRSEALTDPLTNLYNRRGWNRLLASEEDRCRRYGHPASVLSIDLDGLKSVNDTQGHAAGDDLLLRAASTLREASRSLDIVARLGGDEFGVLSVDCGYAGGRSLVRRIEMALAEARVRATIGFAVREPTTGLVAAWEAADRMLIERKRSR